jgi:hypothetical protein
MPYGNISAIEIDKKLREDFRRRLKDYGVSAELTDPILGVLFRTFAQQLEVLYGETDRIRLALLDELIANLGIEPRMARPAQTVVRFLLDKGSQIIAAGTELIGEAETGERLTFTTDATFSVSDAHFAFAAVYQDGALQLLSSVEMPEALQSSRPSLEPVRINLGPNPALFLAIEKLPASHLSQQTFFFELGPDAQAVQRALETETWCLVGSDGELGAKGILRPRSINGGIRALEWLLPDIELKTDFQDTKVDMEAPGLPFGFYGQRLFLFPPVPPSRRFLCKIPRGMDSALTKIFGRESQKLFSEERVWIRISLPREVPSLRNAIGSIALHAITASNVECFNQTISFEKQGTCIPIIREEGGAASHLVAPLSIFGETGMPYLPQMEPSTDASVGRYTIRNGRVELKPAQRPNARPESYANVRLWVTNGSLGNKVGPGQVTGFLKKNTIAGLRLTNPTSAAGGTDQEVLSTAQTRFAEALMSRDRVVTRKDLLNVVRSFDARILHADVYPGVQRTQRGLQRVERITVRVNKDDFVEPGAELKVLKDDLARHLADRFPMGTQLLVEVAA